MEPRPIFDAHLDLAWSAVFFDRDLTLELAEIRRLERPMRDEPGRGRNTVSFPELRRAGVRVCVGTLLARSGPIRAAREAIRRTDIDYAAPAHAYAAAHAQLAYYRAMERAGWIRLVRTAAELRDCWEARSAHANAPMGLILSMECADPVLEPRDLAEWRALGLRAVGPVHYGQGRYGFGTGADGPLGDAGRALVRELDRQRMALDVTHLCDACIDEALELFAGPVLASHHNCRALVPGDRQLSDRHIRQLAGRGAVIGSALDAWMLQPGWIHGQTDRPSVSLEAVADQVDRVCQLAGNCNSAAIGSDLDGGFGAEQTPRDLDTIADLQKLAAILADRGYGEREIDAVFHGNWLRFFAAALGPGEPILSPAEALDSPAR